MVSVSVVVPVYNKEKYIKKCLTSILNQTLSSIEIIVIDDGSTDRSAKVCKKFLKDSRFHYVYQSNSGPGAARKKGIELARGEYIGFVDADDWLELNMYEKMYNIGSKLDADIVTCNIIENENGRHSPKSIPNGEYETDSIIKVIYPKAIASTNPDEYGQCMRWSNCIRIYKRGTVLKNEVDYDARFKNGEDLQFNLWMTLVAKSYVYLGDEYLYHNRITKGSQSRGYRQNMWAGMKSLVLAIDDIVKNYTDFDFSKQLQLRLVLFACECIANEYKDDCLHNENEKIHQIEAICNDELFVECARQIRKELLPNPWSKCFEFIGKRDYDGINRFLTEYFWTERKRKLKNKYFVRPLKKVYHTFIK